jgi:sec-independent protein translocase protein TatB
MFGIDAPEMLLIVIVAVIVIGPKDLPLALRTAGRWIAKVRKVSGHFRAGLDTMIREAELEEMEQKWREQNEKIMREHPQGGPAGTEQTGAYPAGSVEPPPTSAEARAAEAAASEPPPASVEARAAETADGEPQLPLGAPPPPAS